MKPLEGRFLATAALKALGCSFFLKLLLANTRCLDDLIEAWPAKNIHTLNLLAPNKKGIL
jgi:hypothetical protein